MSCLSEMTTKPREALDAAGVAWHDSSDLGSGSVNYERTYIYEDDKTYDVLYAWIDYSDLYDSYNMNDVKHGLEKLLHGISYGYPDAFEVWDFGKDEPWVMTLEEIVERFGGAE